MIALPEQIHSLRSESETRERFSQMLPQIERQLACEFRHLDAEAKQEAVQDGIVNCWIAFTRLVRQGRVEKAFPSVLARFAIRQIREGRTCGARINSFDPLSRYAQRKRGIRVERLDRFCVRTKEWIEPLVEDRRASIPDQVAMRIDVPAWLATLSKRAQQVVSDLVLGSTTGELAKKYGVSAGRISQMRRELYESWYRFHEDAREVQVAG